MRSDGPDRFADVGVQPSGSGPGTGASGTAIVCATAVTNGLTLQGKLLSEVRPVTSGAGAAALASSRRLGLTTTGRTQAYALTLVLGVLLMAVWLLARPVGVPLAGLG